MTNQEATKHIKAAAKLAIDAGYTSDIVDACALAVRALEQEPNTDVLDKIRAEIGRKANSGQWSEPVIYGMQKSIAIIDKYRQEG